MSSLKCQLLVNVSKGNRCPIVVRKAYGARAIEQCYVRKQHLIKQLLSKKLSN